MSKRKKLVIGNWKMNPRTLIEAKRIFSTFKKTKRDDKNVTVVFCPPFPFINDLYKSYSGSKIFFGAQDIFWKEEGSYTGEISAKMLQSVGARFVIVGHSERRSLGENDSLVAQKLLTTLKFGMHAVLCVGEPTRDINGKYLQILKEQIFSALENIDTNLLKKIVIAYEPVWAIGDGNHAIDTHDLYQTILFIKKQIIEKYDRKIADSISILYGGSVDSENANSLMTEGGIDGFLVGRNSLNAYEFAKIISETAKK
jgi:triosephosphate isomerase (TIM)